MSILNIYCSSFLPTLSDPSLTDIDDLLYEDDDEELSTYKLC